MTSLNLEVSPKTLPKILFSLWCKVEALHRTEPTGTPLGGAGFLPELEAALGRSVRRQNSGPKGSPISSTRYIRCLWNAVSTMAVYRMDSSKDRSLIIMSTMGQRLDRSRSMRRFLVSRPPPKPVREPSLPIHRWHGTMMGIGFFPLAPPTALTALGLPIASARVL